MDTIDEMLAAQVRKTWGDPNEPLHPALRNSLRDGPMGPTISHPLIVDIMAMPPMYAMLNKRYAQKIDAVADALKTRNWHSYVYLHERPYRVDALRVVKRHLKYTPAFARLAAGVWQDSENIHQNLHFWRAVFKGTNGQDWMRPEEFAEFKALPKVIKIHRGECNDGAVSWSRALDIARFFAARGVNQSTGMVTSGYVDKANVFAYLTGRGEQEIIVTDRSKVRSTR